MKKIFILLILTYLLFTINSGVADQDINDNDADDEKILKIGVLLPLSGEFQNIGQSFLKAIQLALFDINNKNIKIYPKDSKGNALDSYLGAKELQEVGVKIVLGPIFFDSLERLDEINNVTFISFTNQTKKISKNVIAFGININSQISVIKEYFDKIKVSNTLLLSPKENFFDQTKIVENSDISFDKVFFYDINPKKITNEIERLTKYQERKKDLERRIKILEKSDLVRDKSELKILEQKHTLGEINFDSVIVLDFGERLKSVLTSFMFSDISNKEVNFFTLNQWFDQTLFNENAIQNLHFPAIDLVNLKKYEKRYYKLFKENPNEVSILAYDALGLVYYCWVKNDSQFKVEQLYKKSGFKGLHGKFIIKDNLSNQQLKIYKVSKKKFVEVY